MGMRAFSFLSPGNCELKKWVLSRMRRRKRPCQNGALRFPFFGRRDDLPGSSPAEVPDSPDPPPSGPPFPQPPSPQPPAPDRTPAEIPGPGPREAPVTDPAPEPSPPPPRGLTSCRRGFDAGSQALVTALAACFPSAVRFFSACESASLRALPMMALAPLSHVLMKGFFFVHGLGMPAPPLRVVTWDNAVAGLLSRQKRRWPRRAARGRRLRRARAKASSTASRQHRACRPWEHRKILPELRSRSP